jgi:hypothetical protein
MESGRVIRGAGGVQAALHLNSAVDASAFNFANSLRLNSYTTSERHFQFLGGFKFEVQRFLLDRALFLRILRPV